MKGSSGPSKNLDSSSSKKPEDASKNKFRKSEKEPSGNKGSEEVNKKKPDSRSSDDKERSNDSNEKTTEDSPEKRVEHPFKNVPENKNWPNSKLQKDSSSAKTVKETKEPSYKLKSDIDKDEEEMTGIARRLFDQPLKDLTLGELLGLSKPMREAVKKAIVPKRVPVSSYEQADGEISEVEEILPFLEASEIGAQPKLGSQWLNIEELPKAQLCVATVSDGIMPQGAIYISDPVTQFLSEGGDPKSLNRVLVRAPESGSLMTVYPVVNGCGPVQGILDEGSQIVSMGKETAMSLHIAWDPDIKITMQSANGSLDQTLGLARSVPFLFGNVVVYLQIHVLENVAYKILLGRPFHIITESNVQNFRNGAQVLTLKDPISNRRISLPTYQRDSKEAPEEWPKAQYRVHQDRSREGFRNETSRSA
jgi:hypothetical protein